MDKIILILIMSLAASLANCKTFTFSSTETPWQFYGEGSGTYVNDQGHDKDKNSIWLSTDIGETETTFIKWSDLVPGIYKVTTYVRALDMQKGIDGVSFWHFYDGGYGTISPFMDLYGNYDWRKIEYTIKVKSSELTVWFRLKAPGQVWIDDFQIEKINTEESKVTIGPAVNIQSITKKEKTSFLQQNSTKKILYTFDKSESGHPFSLKNNTGIFSPQNFYNFNTEKMPIKDWSSFDRIEMEIYNPNDFYTEIFVTLTDNLTTNYWSQLNHKQSLAPGWNKLSLSLNQFLGERGSHRYLRTLNLLKLKKFFIIVDPDKKYKFDSNNFLIDNIILSSNPMPFPPAGVMSFDFTSEKAPSMGNITKVTGQTVYNDERGYGFINPKFWRVEDSQYASQVLRYSIGILDGHFKVKLPNGKYQISLIIDKLGYWDVPFWTDRMVSANGNPIFKETRSTGKDFLYDLLKFESIIPDIGDHPFDLYLSKIFNPINKTIEVSNGVLDLEFKGDATGISLNSLVIWNKKIDELGISYKKAIDKRNRDEFDWMSHSIEKNINYKIEKDFSISIIEPDLFLNPKTPKPSSSKTLNFMGGVGETPYQVIQLNPGDKQELVSFSFTDFINEKGNKISSKDIEISDLIYQYTSPDINHETYMLTGKYLKPLSEHSLKLKANRLKYLFLQLKITDNFMKGNYKGEVLFNYNQSQIKLPITITIMPYKLPSIDFPVGFFGLDPLPLSYFSSIDYNEIRRKYRLQALHAIGEAGFTTYTGLPSDPDELEELLKESSKLNIKTVFSYGGQFPQKMIDLNNKPSDQDEEHFFKHISKDLKRYYDKKNWPVVVHTFSDEAQGYSDKFNTDILWGQKLKKYFPFMPLGGFTSFENSDSYKLNSLFDFGFYSSISKKDILKLKNNNLSWGSYGASAGNLDDPRFSFGLGLFIARFNGLSHYLEWHASAFSNYPYYDFDGRETDSVMFYPSMEGKIYQTLRFKMATEGLHTYMKIKLLEKIIAEDSSNSKGIADSKKWLESVLRENNFFATSKFLSNKKINFREFEKKLNENIYNNLK